MHLELTSQPDDIWQKGTIQPGNYSFTAKVYAAGSTYGIEGGPVSKLEVRKPNGKQIMLYDREWLERPSLFRGRAMVKTILKAFPPIEA